ncbi:hypothetical protein BGZ65_012698, partial [Modicella reniformis]
CKYCQGYRIYMDRDAMGRENMAWILDNHIRHQARPTKYMPATPAPTPAPALLSALAPSRARLHPRKSAHWMKMKTVARQDTPGLRSSNMATFIGERISHIFC